MAVVASRYLNALHQMAIGAVDLSTHTLKMALVASTYTPSLAADMFWSDVDAHEITGTGYTVGGDTLTTVALSVTTGTAWGTSWASGVPTNIGDILRPTAANGFVYQASTAGTTGVAQPIWPTIFGETVIDNGIVWTCIGIGVFQFKSDSASWAAATFSARYGVIRDAQTGVDTTEPLLVLVDFGSTLSPVAETFEVDVPALGWWWEAVA